MAAMTLQYGGYFWFKVIYLENKVGVHHFYFTDSMISFSILDRFRDFEKNLSCQNFSRSENVIICNTFFLHARIF
jgi:hypothetical protein